jgi:hypothetical protein
LQSESSTFFLPPKNALSPEVLFSCVSNPILASASAKTQVAWELAQENQQYNGASGLAPLPPTWQGRLHPK